MQNENLQNLIKRQLEIQDAIKALNEESSEIILEAPLESSDCFRK